MLRRKVLAAALTAFDSVACGGGITRGFSAVGPSATEAARRHGLQQLVGSCDFRSRVQRGTQQHRTLWTEKSRGVAAWHEGGRVARDAVPARATGAASAVRRYFSNSSSELSPERVLYGLIGANVAVFGLWQVVDSRLMRTHFTVSETGLTNLRLHTVITSAFSHFDIWHLGGNMLSLYYFGGALGSLFGSTALLQLYLAGGIVASLSHVAYNHYRREGWGRRSDSWGGGGGWGMRAFLPGDPPGLGASGAVNSVILLNTLLWPTRIILVNFFIPVPAIAFGGLALFRDMYMAHAGSPSAIGHAAHIGGAGVGFAAWALVRRRGRFTWR